MAVGGLGGENPRVFPKAGPIFQRSFPCQKSAQTLAGMACRAAGKSGKHLQAVSKFAAEPFQQGISDSHSLLEFLKKKKCRKQCSTLLKKFSDILCAAQIFRPLLGALISGRTQLTFPVPFSKLWVLRAGSSQPNFRLRFLPHGCGTVPPRMTFANYESTFSKPRMDKNKTTNPFGQTTKRCLTAAGATFQNYESEFPNYEKKMSDYDWRIFRLRMGPKFQLRNQNSRGHRTTAKLRILRADSTLRFS